MPSWVRSRADRRVAAQHMHQRQEEARLHDFLANRFGRIYSHADPRRLAP